MSNQEKILEKLKEKEMGFQDLVEFFPNDLKKSILTDIKILLNKSKIVEHEKTFYNVENLEKKQGYIQSNLNNMVWIEKEDKTNQFGIYIDKPGEKLTMVVNKKDSFPGASCEYVEFGDELKTAHILSSKYTKTKSLMIAKKNLNWYIINNGLYNKLSLNDEISQSLNENYASGDIVVVDVKENNLWVKSWLGNIKDKAIETKIVKGLLDLEEKEPFFSSDVDLFDSSVKEKDLKGVSFITIDSPNTKDIDDAIAIKKSKDDWKVYVAIANVDKYVKKDSAWDKTAKEAATTYYMQFDKISMLDKNLTEDLCSLNIGEKKSALVCEMIFDKSGKQKSSKFYEALIEVRHKVPYEDVDAIFSGHDLNYSYTLNENREVVPITKENIPTNLKSQLKALNALTDNLKKQDLPKDYWFLKSPDYKLGEDGKVDQLELIDENKNISQKIVENCMLSANICAANLLKNAMPQIGLFRNQVSKLAYEKPLPANYEFDNIGHWGLQEETYTHFTSPIRRYCDLVVHRLIKSIINKEPSPYSEKEIKDIAEILNHKSYLHKQINIKEKNILLQEYLESLVEKKDFRMKFEMVGFNKYGCLFRNKQNIDVFIPMFKLNREISDYLKPNIEDKDVQKHVDYVNNYWQTKIYLDNYSWLDSKKDTMIKFYLKEHKIEEEISAGLIDKESFQFKKFKA